MKLRTDQYIFNTLEEYADYITGEKHFTTWIIEPGEPKSFPCFMILTRRPGQYDVATCSFIYKVKMMTKAGTFMVWDVDEHGPYSRADMDPDPEMVAEFSELFQPSDECKTLTIATKKRKLVWCPDASHSWVKEEE